MAHPSKRLAVFLCLIILHQDIISARSSYNEYFAISSPSIIRPRGLSKEMIDDNEHQEFKNTVNEVQARHNITLSPGRSLTRNKRFFGLFLFIVSLVVTVVATVVETIYDIKGCCGLGYDFLCGFESDFNTRRDAVKTRSEQVDQKLQEVLKKKDSLECLSEVLKTVWSSINELVRLEEELLGSIDTNFKEILIRTEAAMRDKLKTATGSIDQATVDGIFDRLSASEKALQLSLSWASAAIPAIAAIAGKAYKTYNVNKIYKAMKATDLEPLLKATPKVKKLIGFTQGSAKAFLKSTAVAKFGSKLNIVFKGMKFFKVAGGVLSVLSIAFDLFNIISTFIACQKKTEKAKEACNKLKESETKVGDAEDKVADFDNTIKTGLEATLLEAIRNDELQNALTHIKETIEALPKTGSSNFDKDKCIRIIPENLAKFKADPPNWQDIKDGFLDMADSCVDKLQFSYKCLIARNDMTSSIIDKCRKGEKNFDALYSDAQQKHRTTLTDCQNKGEEFTTEEMFKNALVKASQVSGMEFFTDPCVMNDKFKVAGVCQGNTPEGLTSEQASQIKQKQCPDSNKAPKLDATAITTYCMYIASGFTPAETVADLKSDIPDLTEEDVSGITCPDV